MDSSPTDERLTHIFCEQTLTALRRIMRAVDLHSKDLVKKHGITTPQLILLKEIQKREALSSSSLARAASLSGATVTGIIDRLERRGLVRRRRSQDDRRHVMISVTDAGAAILENAPSPLQEKFIERFSRMRDWEQSQILSSLQRIAEMMDAEDIDASPFLASQALAPPPDADSESDGAITKSTEKNQQNVF